MTANATGAYAEYCTVPPIPSPTCPMSRSRRHQVSALLKGMTAHYLIKLAKRPCRPLPMHVRRWCAGLIPTQWATSPAATPPPPPSPRRPNCHGTGHRGARLPEDSAEFAQERSANSIPTVTWWPLSHRPPRPRTFDASPVGAQVVQYGDKTGCSSTAGPPSWRDPSSLQRRLSSHPSQSVDYIRTQSQTQCLSNAAAMCSTFIAHLVDHRDGQRALSAGSGPARA